MHETSWILQTAVWFLTALIFLSAVWVVILPNLFRAALSLGLVLVGVAGMFLLLEAEFLALVQILVYVGAILTLVVFAIMLTSNLSAGVSSHTSRQQGPAAMVAGVLFCLLARVVWVLPWPMGSLDNPVSLPELGRELITTLVLPFEVVSLVFVAAMVGAIAVAASMGKPRSSQSPSAPRT